MFSQGFLDYAGRIIATATGKPEAQQAFSTATTDAQWPELSLNQRVAFLCGRLETIIGPEVETAKPALLQIVRAFRQDHYPDQGYALMFLPHYLLVHGHQSPGTALAIMEHLTQLVSGEFAVRPLILQEPAMVMTQLLAWTTHPVDSVRRFASEGCRPRLPWGMALKPFQQDPSPIWPILTNLRADDSLFVRKSVANNLNDISKDHPEQALAWAKKHLDDNQHTRWIINHGLRTLLKAGHPEALALMGWHATSMATATLVIPTSIRMGETMEAGITLELSAPLPQARVELGVFFHRPRTAGTEKQSRKVFMVSKTMLQAGSYNFSWHYQFQDKTTRKHYPGPHRMQVILNGQVVAEQNVELIP